jgi:hypothetical protein
MTTAIRQAEADQPVTPGYMYSLYGGGDQYLADRDGEIESWHAYDPERTGLSLSYVDPACSHRPVLLEEFGTDRWNDEKFYDGTAHYALLAGAAGAMSYEWGIRWLARDLGFVPTPLREAVGVQPDPRWFTPDLEMANAWPARAGGIAAIPSGFHWGSIYHGTPFPAGAAVALGRLGLMGGGLARALRPEKVYVVVPTAFNGARDGMDEVTNVVNKLWQEKAVFGMLQEDCLGTLPKTTRLLICPKGVTAASEGKLAELRRSGVEVFTGADDGWRKSAQLPHLSVTPGEGTNLLVRRTVQGTLYGLLNRVPVKAVTLKTERGTPVRMGLSDYVLVQEGEAGINWVEASGEVVVQGSPFCAIDRGRAILASDDGLDLVHSKRVRVLATEPTRIKFSRAIASVAVLEEGRRDALATFEPEAADNFSLDIDSELIRYVLRIELQAK